MSRLRILLLVLMSLTVTMVRSQMVGTTKTTILTLGETEIGLVEWFPAGAPNDDLGIPMRFLNLHQNENCSVVAIKTMLQTYGRGSVLYFNKTLAPNGLANRNVTFTYHGSLYTFDPNRMFTLPGIQTNIYPSNADAANIVLNFGQQVLRI